MKRPLLTAVLGIALCLAASSAMAADTIVTGPLDKAGFQALIDAAGPGDTILCLGGVYDFSDPGPVYFDKGLTIQGADPADPPIFRGDGTFYTPPNTGNNGFHQALGSYVQGMTFQGLVFEDLDRPVAVAFFDWTEPGCPPIPGAGARKFRFLDNTVRNSRRAVQFIGGPAEDIVIKDNDSTLAANDIGILVGGGPVNCVLDGSIFDTPRPRKVTIQGNTFRGEIFVGIYISGGEKISVKENQIEGGFAGVLFSDPRAFYFDDDGPIDLGTVKENVIDGALFGIVAEGPTTITGAQIKDNQISGGLLGVLADFGASGFEIKANDFSGVALAEIYLGMNEENLISDGCGPGVDSDQFACAPDTYNNVVKVYEGDRVFDFGVDNEVKIGD